MKLFKSVSKKVISSEETLVAYLAVKAEITNLETPHRWMKDVESGWLLNVNKLRALHKSTEICLKTMLLVLKTGMNTITKTEQKMLLHVLLALHVASLPEPEVP